MKTCQLTEEFFAIFGIIPHKFIRKRPFNERGILMLLLHSIHILSYSLFMFRVAETFEQCNAAIFMITSAISASNVYITCLWKSVVYFKCIKFIDDTINKSENFFLILWRFWLKQIGWNIYRASLSIIGINLQNIQQICGNIQWIYVHWIGENGTNLFNVTTTYHQLSFILHHGFGKRCICFTISNVVSMNKQNSFL